MVGHCVEGTAAIARPYHNPAVDSAVRRLNREFDDAFRKLREYLQRELGSLDTTGRILERNRFNIDRINRALLPELKAKIREFGFGDVLDTQIDGLKSLAEQVLEQAGESGLPVKFKETTGDVIKNLLQDAQKQILTDETKVAAELESMLRRSMTGNVMWDDLVDRIGRNLQITQRQAMTRADDVVQSFFTTTRTLHFKDAGVDWFLYDGPRDDRNRVFCARFVGTRFTLEGINHYPPRGQEDLWQRPKSTPLPPSQSLGGYGCRHEAVPLVTAEAINRYPVGPRFGKIPGVMKARVAA